MRKSSFNGRRVYKGEVCKGPEMGMNLKLRWEQRISPHRAIIGEIREVGKGKILLTFLDHSQEYDVYSKWNGSHWRGFPREDPDLASPSRFWGD